MNPSTLKIIAYLLFGGAFFALFVFSISKPEIRDVEKGQDIVVRSSVKNNRIYWRNDENLSEWNNAVAKWSGAEHDVVAFKEATTADDVDLKTVSTYRTDAMFIAMMDYGTTTGKIVVNRYMYDSLSKEGKEAVLIHELGHSLGLGHGNEESIMYFTPTNVTVPSKDDKDAYRELWKR